MFGFAGTGKTSLAKHLAEGVEGGVQFCAYTGKAASVLQQRGCGNAATIHSLIYQSRDKGKKRLLEIEEDIEQLENELKKEGMTLDQIKRLPKHKDLNKLLKEEKEALSSPMFILDPESSIRDNDLIIVDECSMVDERMGRDLLSFGVKVIVLGDPAQLPPVKSGGFFTEVKPDVMLENIHRQALDNPIIRMSMMTRNRETLLLGDYGRGCRVITREESTTDDALNSNIIICGKNSTRHGCNFRMRSLLGFTDPMPMAGDIVVCRRNNRDLGILNGIMFRVVYSAEPMDNKIPMKIVPLGDPDAEPIDVSAHTQYFLGEEPEWYVQSEAEKFEFGYGITAHVSQGSQWENVYVFDESGVFKKDKFRWLYTAITRAQERLLIVR